jgi:hypothetical protein
METPFSSPVSPGMYPTIGGTCVLSGFLLTSGYFVYQLSSSKRSIAVELSLGAAASVALGFGSLFVLLSFGLWV